MLNIRFIARAVGKLWLVGIMLPEDRTLPGAHGSTELRTKFEFVNWELILEVIKTLNFFVKESVY